MDTRNFSATVSGCTSPEAIIIFGVSKFIWLLCFKTILALALAIVFNGVSSTFDVLMFQDSQSDLKPVIENLGEFHFQFYLFSLLISKRHVEVQNWCGFYGTNVWFRKDYEKSMFPILIYALRSCACNEQFQALYAWEYWPRFWNICCALLQHHFHISFVKVKLNSEDCCM